MSINLQSLRMCEHGLVSNRNDRIVFFQKLNIISLLSRTLKHVSYLINLIRIEKKEQKEEKQT